MCGDLFVYLGYHALQGLAGTTLGEVRSAVGYHVGLGVRIIPSQKLAFLQYEFYDQERQFIDMQEEIEANS